MKKFSHLTFKKGIIIISHEKKNERDFYAP